MSNTDNPAYFVVKDKTGSDYLCPLATVKNRKALTDRELDECVERDVAGRYAGNIEIEAS